MNPSLPAVSSLPLEDQIREAAYFQWLDRGCPVGDDWANWFVAEQRLQTLVPVSTTQPAAGSPMPPAPASSPAWSTSPSHLHATQQRDQRPEVLSSGAAQRTRARHATGKAPGGFRT